MRLFTVKFSKILSSTRSFCWLDLVSERAFWEKVFDVAVKSLPSSSTLHIGVQGLSPGPSASEMASC